MGYTCTFAQLKADLLLNLDDYSSEVMANLDAIIAEAETKCLRDLDLEIFQDEISGYSLTLGTRRMVRPSGMLKIGAVYLVVSGVRRFIEKRTKGYCEAYGEDLTQGRPLYWAEDSEAYLYFVATPDQAYAMVLYGIVRPPGLSDTVASTWLSTYAGDLLLQAARVGLRKYTEDWAAATALENTYNNDTLPKAKMELRGLGRATYETARTVAPPSQVT